MTSTHVEPTPGPYILSASPISLAGFKHMGARGVPCVVEVEMRWISMNEHDATNIRARAGREPTGRYSSGTARLKGCVR